MIRTSWACFNVILDKARFSLEIPNSCLFIYLFIVIIFSFFGGEPLFSYPEEAVITIDPRKIKGALLGLRQFLANDISLKIMKNAFYYILKALLLVKIFKLLFCFIWSCRKTARPEIYG